jgi:predicted GNAT superfamily acetyltransferase
MTLVSTAPDGAESLAEPRSRARAAADNAVRRAGVSVIEIGTAADTRRAASLLREVWRSTQDPVPSNVLRTVQHTGGYLFGAYDDSGALLAVSMGLLASEGLHSHITGVAPAGQRRGLGIALKQHQRVWALDHGMKTIGWTTDPLVRRNVAFNLHALGAVVTGYLPDHYGPMDDGVNKGDESDRFELRWDLLSPAALRAGETRLPFLERGDAVQAVMAGADGLPVVGDTEGARLLVALPSDIEALRRGDAAAALAWRHAVREAVVPALSRGAAVIGLTSTGELVLEDPS